MWKRVLWNDSIGIWIKKPKTEWKDAENTHTQRERKRIELYSVPATKKEKKTEKQKRKPHTSEEKTTKRKLCEWKVGEKYVEGEKDEKKLLITRNFFPTDW